MPRPGAGARTLPFFFLAVVAGDCSDGSCGVWPECKFGSWFDSSKAACSTCPVGASCKGLTADPICQSGWWRNQTEQPRKNQSFFFVECLVPSACRGFPKDLSCGCRTGHEGTLCARCVRNDHGGDRYMKRFNGECSRCIETDASYVWLWVVLAFFGAYVMAMTMTLNSGTSDRFLVCIYYTQLVSIIISFPLNWKIFGQGDLLDRFLNNFLNAAKLDVVEWMALDCYLEWSLGTKVGLVLLTPLASLAVFAASYYLIYAHTLLCVAVTGLEIKMDHHKYEDAVVKDSGNASQLRKSLTPAPTSLSASSSARTTPSAAARRSVLGDISAFELSSPEEGGGSDAGVSGGSISPRGVQTQTGGGGSPRTTGLWKSKATTGGSSNSNDKAAKERKATTGRRGTQQFVDAESGFGLDGSGGQGERKSSAGGSSLELPDIMAMQEEADDLRANRNACQKIAHVCTTPRSGRRLAILRNQHVRAAVILASVSYVSLTEWSLELLSCIRLRPPLDDDPTHPMGFWYVRNDLDMECGSPEWLALLYLPILGICVYTLGLPFGAYAVMNWGKRHGYKIGEENTLIDDIRAGLRAYAKDTDRAEKADSAEKDELADVRRTRTASSGSGVGGLDGPSTRARTSTGSMHAVVGAVRMGSSARRTRRANSGSGDQVAAARTSSAHSAAPVSRVASRATGGSPSHRLKGDKHVGQVSVIDIFRELDVNQSDTLEFPEFRQMLKMLKINTKGEWQLKSFFRSFDTDNSGSISLLEFATAIHDDYIPFNKMFNVLWIKYKPRYYYWELVIKLSVFALIASHRLVYFLWLQVYFATFVVVAMLLLQVHLKPFKQDLANACLTYCLLCVLMILIGGCLYTVVAESDEHPMTEEILSLVTIAFVFTGLASILINFVAHSIRKCKEGRDEDLGAKSWLRDLPLFVFMDLMVISDIDKKIEKRCVKPGANLFVEGDACDEIILFESAIIMEDFIEVKQRDKKAGESRTYLDVHHIEDDMLQNVSAGATELMTSAKWQVTATLSLDWPEAEDFQVSVLSRQALMDVLASNYHAVDSLNMAIQALQEDRPELISGQRHSINTQVGKSDVLVATDSAFRRSLSSLRSVSELDDELGLMTATEEEADGTPLSTNPLTTT